jgi:hypothetical protein
MNLHHIVAPPRLSVLLLSQVACCRFNSPLQNSNNADEDVSYDDKLPAT